MKSHKSIRLIRRAHLLYLRMTLSLCRSAMVYSPRRLPANPRCASTTFPQSRPRSTEKGGRNLGLRHQRLESAIRSAVRKAALLEEITDTSRLVVQHNSVPAYNKSRAPHEEMEMFYGLVVPKEPKPPESDGELFALLRLGLGLMTRGLVFRMLYVRMRDLRS